MLAWFFARRSGGRFLIRMEDLDAAVARPYHEHAQLDDLAALGVDWDGPVVRQSERRAIYADAFDRLAAEGRTYPCFCTRKEIQHAPSAPHGPPLEGAYPGTCGHLDAAGRARRAAEGRTPALRVRAEGARVSFTDILKGPHEGVVDDFVLLRNDGTPAYNAAVVIDDCTMGVDEVVRGDDLLESTPRHVYLARLLGMTPPRYAHVPLVLGPDGHRLAKRDGAVTLRERLARGETADSVRAWLASSLGLCRPDEAVTMAELAARLDPARLPTTAWTLDARRCGA